MPYVPAASFYVNIRMLSHSGNVLSRRGTGRKRHRCWGLVLEEHERVQPDKGRTKMRQPGERGACQQSRSREPPTHLKLNPATLEWVGRKEWKRHTNAPVQTSSGGHPNWYDLPSLPKRQPRPAYQWRLRAKHPLHACTVLRMPRLSAKWYPVPLKAFSHLSGRAAGLGVAFANQIPSVRLRT